MKLFRRERERCGEQPDAAPAEELCVEAAACARSADFLPIPLSDELRANLEQPLDPKVDRIMKEITEEVAAAQHRMDSRRIIRFPFADSLGHVVRDSAGHLTVLSGEPPQQLAIL